MWRPGGGFDKAFCRHCGSALFSRDPDDTSIVSVRFGAFDDDPPIRPTYRAFVDFAAPFEPIPADGLARYGGRAARAVGAGRDALAGRAGGAGRGNRGADDRLRRELVADRVVRRQPACSAPTSCRVT